MAEDGEKGAAPGGAAGAVEGGGGGKEEEESVKLFVGQVPKHMAEPDLLAMFREVAAVDEVTVIKDKATRLSRGADPYARIWARHLRSCSFPLDSAQCWVVPFRQQSRARTAEVLLLGSRCFLWGEMVAAGGIWPFRGVFAVAVLTSAFSLVEIELLRCWREISRRILWVCSGVSTNLSSGSCKLTVFASSMPACPLFSFDFSALTRLGVFISKFKEKTLSSLWLEFILEQCWLKWATNCVEFVRLLAVFFELAAPFSFLCSCVLDLAATAVSAN
jgi:hypothetical protein